MSHIVITPDEWVRYMQQEATIAELVNELMDWVAQYGCDCGHPSCNRCDFTRSAEGIIAKAKGDRINQ